MSSPVRFLHLADVHIGFRVTRFDEQVVRKLREARFQALDNALRVAEEKQAEFMVISGDLFDDNTVPLTDAQRAYDMLKGKRMPIYVLPGNHDPLCAGSVWQRHPWSHVAGTSLHVLTSREAIRVREGVTLYPCPVTHRTSREDPTEWIPAATESNEVRIGVAHGSVMDREPLPADDHPTPFDAAKRRGLDYLALGHWHQHKAYAGADGAARMAYPGTLEQMGFGAASEFSAGWTAYASGPEREEFSGSAPGEALMVQIAASGAPPILERVSTAQYVWTDERVGVTDDAHFERVFASIATRQRPERCVLRLRLEGLLSADGILKLDSFRQMLDRYVHCELNTDGLNLVPDDRQVEEAAGREVVGEVLKRLRQTLESGATAEERARAQRAVLVLYRLVQEVGG